MPDFKPSQVILHTPPLVGTMGAAELEHAAALVIAVCQRGSDEWHSVAAGDIGDLARAGEEPIAAWLRNPFFKPNVWKLIESGYAQWDGEAGGRLALTEKAFTAIERWIKS